MTARSVCKKLRSGHHIIKAHLSRLRGTTEVFFGGPASLLITFADKALIEAFIYVN